MKKFKVGDNVIVTQITTSRKYGTNPVKELFIGQVGIIGRCDSDGSYLVSSGYNSYFFDPCDLQLVGDATTEPQFKVGDKVKIVRKISTDDWGDSWVRSMDSRVGDGKVYTIGDIFGEHKQKVNLQLDGNNIGWNWPTAALELYKENEMEMTKQEALAKLKELEAYIEKLDKPKTEFTAKELLDEKVTYDGVYKSEYGKYVIVKTHCGTRHATFVNDTSGRIEPLNPNAEHGRFTRTYPTISPD